MGMIKVFVRIKPPNTFQIDKNIIEITLNRKYSFEFDRIFKGSNQKPIFNNIFINSLKVNKEATVICYGSTGSGKTYTMIGTKNKPGLIYQIVNNYRNLFLDLGNKNYQDGNNKCMNESININSESMNSEKTRISFFSSPENNKSNIDKLNNNT